MVRIGSNLPAVHQQSPNAPDKNEYSVEAIGSHERTDSSGHRFYRIDPIGSTASQRAIDRYLSAQSTNEDVVDTAQLLHRVDISV